MVTLFLQAVIIRKNILIDINKTNKGTVYMYITAFVSSENPRKGRGALGQPN